MSIDRWDQSFDWALWIRAAERIDTPPGALVPGPLDIDPLPAPSAPAQPELADGWLRWWHGLLAAPPHRALTFAPPDFHGLDPELREIVSRRFREANDWHSARKRAGVEAFVHRGPRETQVVAEVERALGRRVAPFSLDFIVLPVREQEIREVHPTRFLVPEQVQDGPGWTEWLRALVTRLG